MDFTKILSSFSSFFPASKLVLKPSLPFTVMILSPHPDDESITGPLAFRLQHENGAHVINVAVTLGSDKDRQAERKQELIEACELLDIECLFLDENWKQKEKELKSLIQKYQPSLIIAPHAKDFHPTHIKTSLLCKKVVTSLSKTTLLVAWSEFWAPQTKPNILVEVPEEILALQMEALTKHQGEIKRNPYHLRLPGWMMDNVRRGSEVIGGKGTNAQQMAYGVLYQLQILNNKKLSTVKVKESSLSNSCDLAQMFKLILDAASGSKTKVK